MQRTITLSKNTQVHMQLLLPPFPRQASPAAQAHMAPPAPGPRLTCGRARHRHASAPPIELQRHRTFLGRSGTQAGSGVAATAGQAADAPRVRRIRAQRASHAVHLPGACREAARRALLALSGGRDVAKAAGGAGGAGGLALGAQGGREGSDGAGGAGGGAASCRVGAGRTCQAAGHAPHGGIGAAAAGVAGRLRGKNRGAAGGVMVGGQ